MIQVRVERPARSRNALALGFLLAALVAASLLLAMARPAHASTFTVNSTGDVDDANADDGVCDVSSATGNQCTLRAAIEQANATPGADTIDFFIPDDPAIPGFEVKTISPTSPLPEIADPVTIDGYTQLAASENTQTAGSSDAVLKIELDGTNAGTRANGLTINASKSMVRGLVINRFDGDGIIIGGSTSASVKGNKVEGDFIGTDSSGTLDQGNSLAGVFSFGGTNNVIGGASPEARNVISGNGAGVAIRVSGTGNKVLGNLIGTKKSGIEALGNSGNGVNIEGASKNTIGGTDRAAANTIAFNSGNGVLITDALERSEVSTPKGNRILNNSIFSNGLLGIDLDGDGRTANDAKDPDKGSNALQNFPDLASATTSSGTTTIEGTLESSPRKRFTIQFFSNPSGTDEGKTFIGEKKVKTNRKGKASFTFHSAQTVSVGRAITATATSSGGNTSEFSDPREVVQL